MGRYCFSLLFFLLSAITALNAQADSAQQITFNQLQKTTEKEYGIHQELINGVLFETKNQNVIGHPYLHDYYSNTGSVIYRGKWYSNINLRYDIYDQQLLLLYFFDTVDYKLYLQKEFITEFSIDNKEFILEAFNADEKPKIYQVFGKDLPTRILYFWEKGVSNLYINNSDTKTFSQAQKETFILMNHRLLSFNGNRSFARRFTSEHKSAIKTYLRKNRLKVRHANDDNMELLIQFINNLES